MTKIYFLGDIGGYAEVLRQTILSLHGIPNTGFMPKDKIVIQLGNLTRLNPKRGPEPKECLAIVDRMLENSPNNWVQLLGNHEASLLGDVLAPGWLPREKLDKEEIAIVQPWWYHKMAKLAVSITCPSGDILVTHAGLTRMLWHFMGNPNAKITATRINQKMQLPPQMAFSPGMLVYHGHINLKADIVWAQAEDEFYLPWCEYAKMGKFLPFHQIHGHATLREWNHNQWAYPRLPQLCPIHYSNFRRQTIADIGKLSDHKKARFIGLDWNLQDMGIKKIPPLFTLKNAYIDI